MKNTCKTQSADNSFPIIQFDQTEYRLNLGNLCYLDLIWRRSWQKSSLSWSCFDVAVIWM